MPTLPLLPTSLVGSYAQPDWLIDRAKLAGRFPPRVRAKELWRVAPEHLRRRRTTPRSSRSGAQEDAGLDVLTDGEIRRESYSNHFATALDGVDVDNPGTRAGPQRRAEPGPAHHRADPAPADRGRGHAVPARGDRSHDQDDRARPVHDEPAGPERPLPRHRGRGDGLRGRGERRDPGPPRRRRRRRADRRALHAGPSRRRARLRAGRAERRARRRHRHHGRAHLLRLRRDHPRAARGLLVPAGAGRLPGPTRSRSRPRSPGWTSACCATSPARRSSSG